MKRKVCLAVCLWPFVALPFQPPPETLPDFDARTNQPAVKAPAPEKAADATKALRARLPGVRIDTDPLLGSPRWVTAPGGFLTGPNGTGGAVTKDFSFRPDDPHAPAKRFVEEHQALFGHSANALENSPVKRDAVTAHNGLRSVTWEQRVAGLAVLDARFTAHITKRGELVSLGSTFARVPERLAKNNADAPAIDATTALRIAVTNIGETLMGDPVSQGAAVGSEQRQMFTAAPLPGEATVELTWLPMPDGELRLCWAVNLARRTGGERFLVLVDAANRAVLLRRGLTVYAAPATFRVFTSDNPTPLSPGHATPLTNQPPAATRALLSLVALDTNASPAGWIGEFDNETRGNNVDAHLDLNYDNAPDLPRPQGSPARTFDVALDLARAPSSYGDASVVQLFYWNNWIHDRLYQLGFDEAAGNFQIENFGRGGLGNDPVQADAQDGSGFNNANMYTPPDGSSPRMQMFVFTGPEPDRDSSFDAEIVIHEYIHGLSNRRVGGGVGIYDTQSRGMGEGWSDFYALALLSEPGDALGGNFAMGAYSSFQLYGLAENFYFGIRRYPYSTNRFASPLTFKDIDPDQADSHSGVPISPGLQHSWPGGVHNVGEVWCGMLWEVRAQLIAKHGWTNGNERVLRLVTDGMNLSPANPTFVQARDAILLADKVSGGGDRNEIWTGFARRGLGASASAPQSFTTYGVREAFDLPDGLEISPTAPQFVRGNTGGPFTPTSLTFVLSNSSSSNLSWSVVASANWLSFSASSGTLGPDVAVNVTATPNANANALPQGFYTNTVVFTNRNTGLASRRLVVLRAGVQNYFTEVFIGGDNDLQGNTFTFKPDNSSSYYAVCRLPANGFYSDPNTAQNLFLSDDTWTRATLSGGKTVALYGRRTNEFFVGSNGYITFGEGDYDRVHSLSNHFRLPRVAGLFTDLDPGRGGSVRWQQFDDRVAVTWLGVPHWSFGGSNSFQIEMFFTGEIRLTYPRIETGDALVGLSDGRGLPPDFAESDLTSLVCAGTTVDHFNWDPFGSPKSVNVPFNVTLSARDVFNLAQPNFTGTVAFSARQPGVTVFRADFENGLAGFTISNNVKSAPGLWHRSSGRGAQVGHSPTNSLYYGRHEQAGGGGNYDVGNTAGHVTSPAIDLRPVSPPAELRFRTLLGLEPGTFHDRATVEISGDGGSTFTTVASTYEGGVTLPKDSGGNWMEVAADISAFTGREVLLRFRFDTVEANNNGYEGWYIDDVEIAGTAGALPMTPATSGPFNNAYWSGSVTVQQPAPEVVLAATDALGHTGLSERFTVTAANDLSVAARLTPDHAVVGDPFTLRVGVTNSGPASATGVFVTNDLPAGVTINAVTSSQGSSAINGSRVITTLGTLGNGSGAGIEITFSPAAVGALATTTTVRRAEADAIALNNTARASSAAGLPAISAQDTFFTEGDGTNFTRVFVNLSQAGSRAVSVAFSTVPGTALAGSDFLATNGVLVFPPGTVQRFVTLTPVNDQVFETNETFRLRLFNPTNALLSVTSVVCTLGDNDPVPSVAISSASLLEGNSGTNLMTFQFRLHGLTAVAADVQFNTSSGSAYSDEDFRYTNGLLRFLPGETNKSVLVPIYGDTKNEPDEEFYMFAYSYGFSTVTNHGIGKILNDEPPLIVLTNYLVTEESCGPTNGFIDPGETVTVLLELQNAGVHGTTSSNFTATLLATNGVLNPSGPQVFGVLAPYGPSAMRPFIFTARAGCGSNLVLTLQLRDGTTNIGVATYSLRLGKPVAVFAEYFDGAEIPDLPEGWGSYSPSGYPWHTVNSFSHSPPQSVHTWASYTAVSYLFSPPITVASEETRLQFRHWLAQPPRDFFYFGFGSSRLLLLTENEALQDWPEAGGWFERGGYTNTGWEGSFTNFLHTVARFPTHTMGETVRVVWEFETWTYRYGGGAIRYWLDSVEVLDGYTCCDGITPVLRPMVRQGNNVVLRWSAISNRTYRVEWRAALNSGSWTALAGDVIATGTAASKTNAVSGIQQRFYRVLLLP